MCHQSVGLIQSIMERAGLPTVLVTMLREITERVAQGHCLSMHPSAILLACQMIQISKPASSLPRSLCCLTQYLLR